MMATIFSSLRQLVHDTAAGLIEDQIPTKLANTVNSLVTSSFGIITDLLSIVRDLSKSDTQAPPASGP
jgi:hypothetical protein